MSNLVALSNNVRLLKFGDVYEVWTCPVTATDFARTGAIYLEFGRALGAARKAAARFGQTLDIDAREDIPLSAQ